MRLSKTSRRTFLAGAASLALAPAAGADADVSPLAHGALADNVLAKAFKTAPPQLPDVQILGPKGTRSISEFKGRTTLMPLWAEWCGPCLSELQDFATLQKKYGNDKFQVIPILTGMQKRLTPVTIAQLFAYLHADVFEPLIENRFGGALMTVMARDTDRQVKIPCNLIIAPDGRVIGREFGLEEAEGVTATTKHQLIAQAEAGNILSLWGKKEGDEFAAAMANGFLG